jgi:16S rRNA G966 N2-methylase RsmD
MLSRGAAAATFVEKDPQAADVIVANLAFTRLAARGRVTRADALSYLRDRAVKDGPFDVVIVDPPYAETALMDAAMERLGAAQPALLNEGCWVVAKHFWRTPPPQSVGLLASARTRRFGETALTFYRLGEAEDVTEGSTEAEPQEDGN